MAVAVVGAGIVGLSAALALRDRGAEVTVFERGVPGDGQSGGRSRLFRHAHDDPRLIRWAQRSRAIYADWERRFGVELVSPDGALALGPAVEHRLPLLEDAGVDAHRVDRHEVARRLPLLAAADDLGPVMFDAQGGAIRTRAAVDVLTSTLGEALRAQEVLTLRPTGGGVEVRAGETREVFDHVVVCAGAGSAPLARQLGLSLPVDLQVHVRATFRVRGSAPEHLACLQDSSGAFGETGVYAAAVPGNDAYAVGLGETAEVREDGSVVDPAELAEHEERVRDYVGRALPGLAPHPVEVKHCWVTALPWSDDGVAVWQVAGVSVLAGHNLFKQAPALGEALASAALGGGLASELRPDARLGEAP
ncbi:NAD(P)/FAD-dependent oxidoreductase [Egicoccus sp. AB-alg2]|uniref:NAD(P)/FAD-dependent oxidoreductase n=1 Tax=Egicoccus sp. AB-alg2 TaxID=3242693 RepID=UPI00359D0C08